MLDSSQDRDDIDIEKKVSNMKEFTDSLDEISDTLMHEFISEPVPSGGPVPFTGLALNSDTYTFYTVHTYPERGISITSRTIIALPVLSNTT